MARQQRNPVVVVGAGMAGLLAARALAEQAVPVTVVDRDDLPMTATPRARVPQGRQLHILLSAGLGQLRAWFPGIEEELQRLGAAQVDGFGAWIHQGGAYRARGELGRPGLSLTRPLLEQVVRQRVAALPGVSIEAGATVERVALTGLRVTGVVVGGHVRATELEVDASGRSSGIAHELARDGVLDPPVTHVGIDIGYVSFFLRRSPGDFEGDVAIVIGNPGTFRSGAALPVEGDRWNVMLSGVHGDAPPSTEEGVAAFARSLSSPTIAQLIEHCARVSDIESYRFPSSRRRHYERVADLPAGLVTVGDAACSFDPVYGQGMTSAALQAAALGRAVARTGPGAPGLPRHFHRHAARIIDAPWRIAVGGDFGHPETVGPRPLGTRQLNGYTARVIQAAHASLPVARVFNRVLQLEDPPLMLFRPDVVARVLTASRRSPVVTGAAVRHPRVGPPPESPDSSD
ncbi:NAD(P)/FAD-dependent oxidoreductase [Terrabacter sp. BE26]|uniref:NAD(P)/FAD-dependent oxidoreductase n=1 Tax=Terrabacter sp. BE26 TaxID=2898152 RepID=UPI0035BE76F5